MDLERSSRAARYAFALSCRLARFAHLIIFNSRAGLEYHVARGYPRLRSAVIRNGIDTERWRPEPEAGAALRRTWGVGSDAPLIGIVARLDRIKGHETFIRAAALLARDREDVTFVIAGTGDSGLTARLRTLAAELGIEQRLIWAGGANDPVAVYNALDIVTSSSLGEGFPNVVAEAMACGRPCVATDVGDTRELLGDDSLCVPPSDAAALHDAWSRVLSWDPAQRAEVGSIARERVTRQFSIEALGDRTARQLATLGACTR
jgi:glycosyltransferase involved in cell wall biosynthesis